MNASRFASVVGWSAGNTGWFSSGFFRMDSASGLPSMPSNRRSFSSNTGGM